MGKRKKINRVIKSMKKTGGLDNEIGQLEEVKKIVKKEKKKKKRKRNIVIMMTSIVMLLIVMLQNLTQEVLMKMSSLFLKSCFLM